MLVMHAAQEKRIRSAVEEYHKAVSMFKLDKRVHPGMQGGSSVPRTRQAHKRWTRDVIGLEWYSSDIDVRTLGKQAGSRTVRCFHYFAPKVDPRKMLYWTPLSIV